MIDIEESYPESDRLEGAPHPRQTARIFGQNLAQNALLQAVASGRMHHAWLLTGPKGIGKATLAWHVARYLLANPPTGDFGLLGGQPPPQSLDVAPNHPVVRRVAALSDPGLLPIRRAWDADRKRFKSQITVEDIRKLSGFFGLSSAEGGYRVVIIDSAEEMNTAAANALLKVLEEPPKHAVLFLVSHRPARLLPTIRSRCRELRLTPLNAENLSSAITQAGGSAASDVNLTELSGGSVGEALRLAALDGPAIYREIVELISKAPRMDRQQAIAIAENASQRGADERLDLTIGLLDTALARLARHGAGKRSEADAIKGEAEVFSRLSPDIARAKAWANVHKDIGNRIARGRSVNIDPATLLIDSLLSINETVALT